MSGFLTCNSCNREYSLRAVHSVQLVCRHCQQLIRKDDTTARYAIALPREDMSVLRLGTTGNTKKGTFEIIGRVQHFYEQGYRNLWYLLYQNGDCGWLGDWEGGYSLLTHYPSQNNLGSLPTTPGIQIKAFDAQYELRRICRQIITCIEGELPELNLRKQGFLALELGNQQEQLVLVHAYTSKDIEAFTGTFEYLKSLSFNHLRPHHEWV